MKTNCFNNILQSKLKNSLIIIFMESDIHDTSRQKLISNIKVMIIGNNQKIINDITDLYIAKNYRINYINTSDYADINSNYNTINIFKISFGKNVDSDMCLEVMKRKINFICIMVSVSVGSKTVINRCKNLISQIIFSSEGDDVRLFRLFWIIDDIIKIDMRDINRDCIYIKKTNNIWKLENNYDPCFVISPIISEIGFIEAGDIENIFISITEIDI